MRVDAARGEGRLGRTVLTINSYNYGAWSMRSWLACRLSGLDFEVASVDADDPSSRAELLMLSPSFLVPSLEVDGLKVWDTLAIAEYLQETQPGSGLLPADRAARAHCRSVSAELHSGFHSLRSALPMNIRARHQDFNVWPAAEADIERIAAVWADCLDRYGGPWLFGGRPTVADAMYSPECTRFRTYGVSLEPALAAYCRTVLDSADVREWTAAAGEEPDALLEPEGDF